MSEADRTSVEVQMIDVCLCLHESAGIWGRCPKAERDNAESCGEIGAELFEFEQDAREISLTSDIR
jgi:hypothetical protein